jgi:ribosomal protein S27E
MRVLGDVAKVFLISTIAVGVVVILQFILLNQIALALLLLLGLIIPFSVVAIEFRKKFMEFQCRKCKHNFKVSYLRLVFTLNFRGKDPAPTGTAAYHLKCPKCGDKSWLVPLE